MLGLAPTSVPRQSRRVTPQTHRVRPPRPPRRKLLRSHARTHRRLPPISPATIVADYLWRRKVLVRRMWCVQQAWRSTGAAPMPSGALTLAAHSTVPVRRIGSMPATAITTCTVRSTQPDYHYRPVRTTHQLGRITIRQQAYPRHFTYAYQQGAPTSWHHPRPKPRTVRDAAPSGRYTSRVRDRRQSRLERSGRIPMVTRAILIRVDRPDGGYDPTRAPSFRVDCCPHLSIALGYPPPLSIPSHGPPGDIAPKPDIWEGEILPPDG